MTRPACSQNPAAIRDREQTQASPDQGDHHRETPKIGPLRSLRMQVRRISRVVSTTVRELSRVTSIVRYGTMDSDLWSSACHACWFRLMTSRWVWLPPIRAGLVSGDVALGLAEAEVTPVGRRRGACGSGPFPAAPGPNRTGAFQRIRLSSGCHVQFAAGFRMPRARRISVTVSALCITHTSQLRNPSTAWPPSPCGRLSRPPWRGVTPATTTGPLSPWDSRPVGDPAFVPVIRANDLQSRGLLKGVRSSQGLDQGAELSRNARSRASMRRSKVASMDSGRPKPPAISSEARPWQAARHMRIAWMRSAPSR